jgi:LPS-assembly protein
MSGFPRSAPWLIALLLPVCPPAFAKDGAAQPEGMQLAQSLPPQAQAEAAPGEKGGTPPAAKGKPGKGTSGDNSNAKGKAAESAEGGGAPLPLKLAEGLGGLRLKASMNLGAIPPEDEAPTFLTAQHISGQSEYQTNAEGDVELRKGPTLMLSDTAVYHTLEDEIEAKGHVFVEQQGLTARGPYMKLKLADQVGYFDRPEYTLIRTIVPKEVHSPGALPMPPLPPRKSTATGHARKILFEGENHYRLHEGTYSTCKRVPGQDEDWYAKARDITLDYDKAEGTAKDMSVYFKGLPIAWAPYMSFPLDAKRKSGFLAPTYTSSTHTGLDLTVPYYWNIAPNYDATIAPRVMSKRGVQLGLDTRYADAYTQDRTRLEYLANDRETGERRYAYNIKHKENLGYGLHANIDWNGVSDDEYFTDLSTRVVETSQRQLERRMVFGIGRNYWNANLQIQRYQTLNPKDDNDTPFRSPYFMLPRLEFNARQPDFHGTDLQLKFQHTRFSADGFLNSQRSQLLQNGEGDRTVLAPSISWSFVRPGFFFTPKLGLNITHYSLKNRREGLPETLTRSLPIFSLDSGLVFERNTAIGGRNWLQTLEPRLYYVYIPYKNQNDYPIFDTGINDFNFGQIFTPNRFSGYDRINDANELTAALTSRLIDPETGAERLRAMVGQRFYLSQYKVGMSTADLARNSDNTSDTLFAFSGEILPFTRIDMGWQYSLPHSRNERYYTGLRYQPTRGRTLSASYRYDRGTLDPQLGEENQVDFAFQWPVARRWYAVGRYNYSFKSESRNDNGKNLSAIDGRLLEGILGLEYNAGCWVFRIAGQRLETTAGDPNTSLFFQLELNDFGQIGSNPINMFRRSISGYQKINEFDDNDNNGMLLPED